MNRVILLTGTVSPVSTAERKIFENMVKKKQSGAEEIMQEVCVCVYILSLINF